MRAFVACPIPQEVVEYVQTLRPLLTQASLIIPKQLDITIKFLGNVPDDVVPEVKRRLSTVHFRPFKAQLSSLDVFSEHMIRVVWIGLQPHKPFMELHSQIDSILTSLFPTDDRFLPHITIARVKSVRDKKLFLNHLRTIPIEPISFPIDRILMIQSELTSHGAMHTPLVEIQATQ